MSTRPSRNAISREDALQLCGEVRQENAKKLCGTYAIAAYRQEQGRAMNLLVSRDPIMMNAGGLLI